MYVNGVLIVLFDPMSRHELLQLRIDHGSWMFCDCHSDVCAAWNLDHTIRNTIQLNEISPYKN